MKKIAIICPYFGNFPTNINITFESMNKNQFIDWFIFTDNGENYKKYNNIFFIKFDFLQMKELIKKRIGTEVYSEYKICDYKPTFGYLFEEYIKEYEFWGYCDVDVIFGDLSSYFMYDKLENYDKIYDLGHLSIYRNTKKIREAFMGNKDIDIPYKKILNARYIYVFDETYNKKHISINEILNKMGYKIYSKRDEFADIDIKYNNFYPNNIPKEKYYYFIYKNNKLFLKKTSDENFQKEVAYIHLQQKKNLPINCSEIENLIITPKGFFNRKDYCNKLFFDKKDFKLMWIIKFRIKRKMNKIKGKYNLIK